MTSPVDPHELAALALRAAQRAVELIHHRRPDRLEVTSKSTATDMVTQMDRAAEELIRDTILGERPGDRIVGEEDGDEGDADSPVVWFVDPIDGTTNYVYDHPGYNVSIAAAVGPVMTVGVVADPTHGRTYRAIRGEGAVCEDHTTSRSVVLTVPADPPPIESMLVATGFGYEPDRRARQGEVVAKLLPRVRDIRRMGAAALDLCSVAAGRVDAYYESGLSIWDLAAGSLIAREAGATVGRLGPASESDSPDSDSPDSDSPDSGSPDDRHTDGRVLVAHPRRFDELAELLRSLGADRV